MIFIVKILKKLLSSDIEKRIIKLRVLKTLLLHHGSVFSNGGGSYILVEWMVNLKASEKKDIIKIHKEICKVYSPLGEALSPIILNSKNNVQDTVNITEINRLFTFGERKLLEEKKEML